MGGGDRKNRRQKDRIEKRDNRHSGSQNESGCFNALIILVESLKIVLTIDIGNQMDFFNKVQFRIIIS